jgi:hypothetical protein
MLQRFRNQVGTAGLIISIVALVAALGGGAYAASGGLSGKQKKEVEKIAKKFAGKPGPIGATGPAGSNGTNGSNGAKGEAGTAGTTGKDGTSGTNGTNGSPGASVEAIPINTGEPECDGEGGAFYEVEGSTEPAVEICNGKEGSPWVAGGLPAGKTEMGQWAVGKLGTVTVGAPGAEETVAVQANPVYMPISFTVPLLEGKSVTPHYVNPAGEEEEESTPTGPATICTGSVSTPTAPAGVLCLYTNVSTNATFEFWVNASGGSARTGRTGTFNVGANGFARGDWAMTAPTP